MRLERIKKSTALALVLILTGLSIAGCGPSAKTVKDNPQPETANAGKEDKPLKFSIAMSDSLNDYIKKTQDPNQEKWLLEFNKRFNTEMTLRILDHKKLMEQMQIMFASGDIPDIVQAFDNYTRPDLAGSVQAGVFMPLDDILAQNKNSLPNLMQAIPKTAWDEMKYEGKTYGIPAIYLSVSSRRGTYIRKDLLDKFGLKIPKTIDEFVEVMRVFKANGVKYPYAGREKWDYTDVFFGAFGVYKTNWNPDKDGNLVPDMITPSMKEALEFHAMLRKEGLMDQEALTTNGSDWNNKINAGNVGIWNHNASSLPGYVNSVKANVPGAEVILIPSPIGKGGPGGNQGMFKYSSVIQTVYINKNFKEPARFLKLLDKLSLPESQEYFSFGIEGTDYTKKDGKIQYTAVTDPNKSAENSWRKLISLTRDDAFDKAMLPFQPSGKETLDWFLNVGPKEGLVSYDPGGFKALTDHPELRPGSSDLFYEAAAKIFFGQATPDTFDNFVKEWKKRGGDKMIKEATEIYKAGKGFPRK